MPRKPRILMDGGVYHLISRGNNQLDIFSVDGGHQRFMELLRLSKAKFSWKIYHYCLMANHFHILAQIETGLDLPKIMRYLLREYSIWYRYQTKYTGYLWSGRYKNPLINRDSYMLECGRYIERNPVRAGLVKNPGNYLWSSYRHYAHGIHDALVDQDPNFENIGSALTEKQRHYQEFVELVPGRYTVPFSTEL